MIEPWERSVVIGDGENVTASETVLHKRGQDVLGMAMRRNPLMAACSRIETITVEAFTQIREDMDSGRRKADIPRDPDRNQEEWDW